MAKLLLALYVHWSTNGNQLFLIYTSLLSGAMWTSLIYHLILKMIFLSYYIFSFSFHLHDTSVVKRIQTKTSCLSEISLFSVWKKASNQDCDRRSCSTVLPMPVVME